MRSSTILAVPVFAVAALAQNVRLNLRSEPLTSTTHALWLRLPPLQRHLDVNALISIVLCHGFVISLADTCFH